MKTSAMRLRHALAALVLASTVLFVATESNWPDRLARRWLGDGRRLPSPLAGLDEPRTRGEQSQTTGFLNCVLRWWFGDASHVPQEWPVTVQNGSSR